MSKKLSVQQERFCEFVVQGMPGGRAYEAAGYKVKGDSADAKAARLVGNGRVKDKIDELRAKTTSKVVKTATEVKEALTRLMDLAERDGDYSGFTQLSNRLAKMEGHDEPEKVQISTVGSVLEMMRKGDE